MNAAFLKHIAIILGLSLTLDACNASLTERHVNGNSGSLALAANALGSDSNSFSSAGDPHLTAGNNDQYDNQMAGYFTDLLSASLQGAIQAGTAPTAQTNTKWWLLLVTGQRSCYNAKIYCGPGAARNKLNLSAHLLLGTDIVNYQASTGKLHLNGINQDLANPINLAQGGTVTHGNGGDDGDANEHLTIVSPAGDQILIDLVNDGSIGDAAYLNISGTIAANRPVGHVEGAFGDFNNDTTEGGAMIDRDGQTAPDLTTFLNSWRTSDQEKALLNIK